MDWNLLEGKLAAPARRALEGRGVCSFADLARLTRTGLEELHGIGKTALAALEQGLGAAGLDFADEPASPEVDAYIEGFSGEARARLYKVRRVLRATLPKAREKMAYGMPTYYYGENLIHFAAFKNHLGLYPTPEGVEAFAERMAGYKQSKGAVQFPYDSELPEDLIGDLALNRLAQARARART